MNGMKTEEMGSRKKYLAPVVVLLLCLVSLTGAAYAYSSTLTNTGNSVDADYLSIDLKQDAGAVAGDAFALETDRSVVAFTDHFSYENATAKKNQIGFELADDKLIVTYKVTVSRETGNTAAVNLIVSVPAEFMTQAMFTVSDVSKTMKDLFDVKISLDGAAAVALDTEYKATFADRALGDHTVAVIFDGKVADGYTTAEPFDMTAGQPANKTASAWQSAIGTKAFALTFEAVSA